MSHRGKSFPSPTPPKRNKYNRVLMLAVLFPLTTLFSNI